MVAIGAEVEPLTLALRRLASWAAGVRFADLPPHVVDRAKTVFMDDLGAILGGSLEPEMASIRQLRLTAAASGGSTVLAPGLPRVDRYTAAEINGTAGCWLELDEGFRLAVCHAGLYSIPAAFALAEEGEASGSQFLLALVTAYEMVTRIARAFVLPPLVLHPHGLLSPIAAAMATAKLRRFDAERTLDALTSAIAVSPATPMQHAMGGALARNLWSGFGARTGMVVAEYAALGVSGLLSAPEEVFVRVLRATPETIELVRGLGEDFAITLGYHKKYACCQYGHSALTAILAVRARHPNRDWLGTVASIEIETHQAALALAERKPQTTLGARFSLPHAAAATLMLGTAGRLAFTTATLSSAAISALRERVSMAPFEPLLPWPKDRPARVTIRFHDGASDSATCVNAPGDPVNPLSPDDLREKFADLLTSALDGVDPTSTIEMISNLDRAASVGVVRQALGKVRGL